ncbi:MAG: sigma-54 dependent transcriptional regulator [Syntrophorhabdaceae bacterium]|nr:sigma-54 dependent transcriptional regulator [Syntrophorhabdaceae bacterium]
MQHVLVIDGNEDIRLLLKEFFGADEFEVSEASDGEAGLELLRRRRFNLLLVDAAALVKDGFKILQEIKNLPENVPAIAITENGSIESATEAVRLGAFGCVEKPLNLDVLKVMVDQALSFERLEQENATPKRQSGDKYDFRSFVGNSPRMREFYRILEKVSDTDSTILIAGESGTGKELAAKTIHHNSSRADRPFVPINCGAIPRELLESELFGHEKGAFTGAISARTGRFELANSGTIFLDEVTELPFDLQVKLLRVVQEREFERIGGTKTIKVNIRILAATNRELEKAVSDGTFREDLYYRLNVIPLNIPSLRERNDDIMLLFEHFMSVFCKKRKRELLKIAPEVRKVLAGYRWPGNVRELENIVERMVILNDSGIIGLDDLPGHILDSKNGDQAVIHSARETQKAGLSIPDPWTESGINLNAVLGELERTLILQALERAGGVKNKAAILLGLNRTTLLEKIKKMGLSTPTSVS